MKDIQQQIDKLLEQYKRDHVWNYDESPSLKNCFINDQEEFVSELATLLLSVQDERDEKSVTYLREVADECERIGEILKVKNLEIAEDIWKMEDSLLSMACKIENEPYAWEPTKEEV